MSQKSPVRHYTAQGISGSLPFRAEQAGYDSIDDITDDEPIGPETRREGIEERLTVEEPHLIRLSADDSRRIAEALLEPPESTPALKEAVRRYRGLEGNVIQR